MYGLIPIEATSSSCQYTRAVPSFASLKTPYSVVGAVPPDSGAGE